MAGSRYLKRGPAKPQHEAVKVESRLRWKPRDAGDARTMGHLPNKPSSTKWRWLKIETMGSARSRAGWEWGYPSPLEPR